MMKLNKYASFLACGAAMLFLTASSASAVPLVATGWNVDFILGSGETYAAHAKPENANIWFANNSSVNTLGLPSSGAVTVGGLSYQLQPYTGGTANVLRSNAATNTLTLVTPGKFSTINILGSNTGGTVNDPWSLVLNFTDGPSSSPITYNAFGNWAGSGPGLNPQLTGNGTSPAFGGQLNTVSLNLNTLGFSGFTLSSIGFRNTGTASGNMAIFALAGEPALVAAIPEPATATLGLLALGGLMLRRRRMA